jgi:hypothetical protein
VVCVSGLFGFLCCGFVLLVFVLRFVSKVVCVSGLFDFLCCGFVLLVIVLRFVSKICFVSLRTTFCVQGCLCF